MLEEKQASSSQENEIHKWQSPSLSSCCQRRRIRPAMRLDCGTVAQIQSKLLLRLISGPKQWFASCFDGLQDVPNRYWLTQWFKNTQTQTGDCMVSFLRMTNSSQRSAPNKSAFLASKTFFVAVEGIRRTQNNQPGLRKSDLEPWQIRSWVKIPKWHFNTLLNPKSSSWIWHYLKQTMPLSTISHGFAIDRAFLGIWSIHWNLPRPQPVLPAMYSGFGWCSPRTLQGSVRAFFSGGPEVFPKAQSLVSGHFGLKKICCNYFEETKPKSKKTQLVTW